jgi:TRAP-type C4-dicarboxylate transport system substrate-binding protein
MKFMTLLGCAKAVALSAVLATPSLAADMRLKLAGVFPADHQGTKMMEQVKADIEAADVGLKVSVFPASQLGSGEALLEDTIRGNIDFTSAFIYADTDARLDYLSMPFLVTNWDEMDSVMRNKDSEFSKILTEIMAEYDIRVLASNPEGFAGIVATKEPDNWNTDGAKGMNIRVWSSNVVKAMVETLGFQATTMAWGDIFPAIQGGIVDGAICCTKSATDAIFANSNVGSHYIELNAIPENTFYYASEKTWQKLNDEQRAVVEAAFTKASDDFFEFNRTSDAKFAAALEEKGYTILRMTDEEQAAIAAKIRAEVWPTMEGTVGKDIIDRLMSSGS